VHSVVQATHWNRTDVKNSKCKIYLICFFLNLIFYIINSAHSVSCKNNHLLFMLLITRNISAASEKINRKYLKCTTPIGN